MTKVGARESDNLLRRICGSIEGIKVYSDIMI